MSDLVSQNLEGRALSEVHIANPETPRLPITQEQTHEFGTLATSGQVERAIDARAGEIPKPPLVRGAIAELRRQAARRLRHYEVA